MYSGAEQLKPNAITFPFLNKDLDCGGLIRTMLREKYYLKFVELLHINCT